MKKIFLSTILCCVGYWLNGQCVSGTSQVTLLGAKNNPKFHQLQMISYVPHSSDSSETEILAEAWTCNGIGYPICNFRATLKYELNQIPQGAIITSANLYLYARTNSTNALVGSPTYGANNDVSISRVTNPWNTNGVGYGWDDQLISNQDQVVLPASTNNAQNYVANLTNLVQFWVNNPDSNFGMQLKQIDENHYKSMIFHSGTSVPSVQPRLEICYWTEEQYPTVYGTAFFDTDNNGIRDSTEIVAPFVKVALSNGIYTYTDINGFYEVAAKTVGSYNVAVTAPNFYTSTNLNVNHTFTNYGQRFLNNIPFVATSNTDSINIHIIPFHQFARPGFQMPCFIDYENLGNTILTPTVAIGFDTAKQDYDSCSEPNFMLVNNIFGGTVVTTIKPGERHFFVGYLTNKNTLALTDTVHIGTAINAGTAWAIDETFTPVRASYDPNDKEATAMLTPIQVATGKYIDYTIRFENVGTDTAFNIVIKDTLSSWLQANTLQMISSSAACKVTVNGKYVKFEFKNIKLLYHSLNAIKSMGFVKFRVKPISSIAVGTTIPNKAAIYFDFNAPIITNIATTIIKNASVLPLKIKSYEVSLINEHTTQLQTSNAKQILNVWTTTNEVNVSHFNIQRSINGKEFETIGKVNAGNTQYQFTDNRLPITVDGKLYYKLQIVDKDGSKQYSEIKRVTLNEQQETSNIVLFPNPATSTVNMICAGAKQIMIIDYLGREIYQSTVNTQPLAINCKQLQKGIYIVKAILNNGATTTQKLIVE